MDTQPRWTSPYSHSSLTGFWRCMWLTLLGVCCFEKVSPSALGAALLDTNSFQAHVDFATSGSQENSATGDLDGDGRLDVVAPNTESLTVTIFRNTGTAGIIGSSSLQLSAELACPGTPMSVAIGDVDGDGKRDVLVVSREGILSVFRNIG